MLDPSHPISELLREDKRYTFEAYAFVFEALSYTHDVLGLGTEGASEPVGDAPDDPDEESDPKHHVSGQELCEAARQFALNQYGYMAQTVLNSWGICTTGDIGEIVFNLIRIGQMRKTASDRREDFDDVFDFDTALRKDFRIAPSD